jgi:hypothetical protein
MLKNFFKLDNVKQRFENSAQLLGYLETNDTLEYTEVFPDRLNGKSKPSPNTQFENKTFRNVRFSSFKFFNINFQNCKFIDCLFINTQFIGCSFHRSKFVDCNAFKAKFRDTYIDPNIFILNKKYQKYDRKKKTSQANIGAGIYHELFLNAMRTHQPHFASEAEFLFKKWSRKEKRWSYGVDHIGLWEYLGFWLKDYFWYLVSGYGQRISWFMISTLLITLLCSTLIHVIWSHLGLSTSGGSIPQGSLLTSAYYTVVITTTLGFGDITPTTEWGRILSMFLTVGGLMWYSILAAVIIKKALR